MLWRNLDGPGLHGGARLGEAVSHPLADAIPNQGVEPQPPLALPWPMCMIWAAESRGSTIRSWT
jgi:hypothetical protein